MGVPDYLKFEKGNPQTDYLADEWFQTTDLFGYFEKYRVRPDGTLWLTPTKMVPSGRKQKDVDAHELVKVDCPEVQILLNSEVTLCNESEHLIARFTDGKIISIKYSYLNGNQ